MNTLPNYDDITKGGRGETVRCYPEVYYVSDGLRVVLVGKKFGTLHAICNDASPVGPEIVIERKNGEDSLGVAKWDRVRPDAIELQIISHLAMTIRSYLPEGKLAGAARSCEHEPCPTEAREVGSSRSCSSPPAATRPGYNG